jgi:positive regulator of sigma E activity
MVMECRAEVIESSGKKALVRVARINCAECGGCGLLARNREQVMEFTVSDRLGVESGDEVIIHVPSRRLYIAYLTMFGLPLLAMAAAYFTTGVFCGLIGAGSIQGPGIISAVIAGLVAFWGGIKLAEKLGLSPFMLEVVRPEQGSDSGESVSGNEIGGSAGKITQAQS